MKEFDTETLIIIQQLIDDGNLIVFDEDTGILKSVESFWIDGPSIQLNVERWGEDAI